MFRKLLCSKCFNTDASDRCRAGAFGRVKPLKRARYFGPHILPCKNEIILDLQIFSRKSNIMKNLQWTSNATLDLAYRKART